MMSDDGAMWFGGGYMWFLWIILPIIGFLAFKLLFDKSDAGKNSRSSHSDTATDILKKRFANGEIDKAEYNERFNELNK